MAQSTIEAAQREAVAPGGSAQEPPQLTHRQILTVFTGLMLGMLVASLSQTIVGTALPTIVGELGGQDQLSWVVSATLLAATASTPVWGKLSDLYGRKTIFQSTIAIFLVGSLVSGFAQDMGMLIGSRALQGLGVGGIMAMTQAIMGDVTTPRERGRYQGYIGAVFGLSTVAGPLAGGFLVEHLSWRWCFWVGIPIGILALVVTERSLQFPFPRRQAAVDWWGALFIVGSVSALLLVLSLGGKEFAWASGWTAGLLAAAVALLVLAVRQERRTSEPIMPPHLFANHTFRITSLAGLVVGVAMFGAIIYLPQYLQVVRLQSPTASGLHTIPLMVGLLLASIGSGRVIVRTGRYKLFPVLGLLIAAAGLASLSLLEPDTSFWLVSASMFVTGSGIGLSMQVLVLATQNAVAREDLGVATSGATFWRSLGGAVGVSAFGALLTHRLGDTIPAQLAASGVPASQLQGGAPSLGSPAQIAALPEPLHTAVVVGFNEALQTTFLAAAPFALVGFLTVLFLRELPLRTGQAAAGAQQAADGGAPAGAAPGAGQALEGGDRQGDGAVDREAGATAVAGSPVGGDVQVRPGGPDERGPALAEGHPGAARR
ncbi:MDR family MFS transporter [Vallicoccus soli]|uniref:MFS transporter n=1 Tax=Vallicoccus soli TaxID=2339232 RepID=A0A3A3ZII5_9ACTN|nr:MDR family MFS transporter [Vallicoccus soli]RJK95326.1 MFS transporter [Vallicoccus soli]